MISPLVKFFVAATCAAWPLALALDPAPMALRGVSEGADPSFGESLISDDGTAALKSPFGRAFGIALGTAMMGFAGRSIQRTKAEKKRIQQMFNENTTAQQLQTMADSGKALPSVVIVRGVASADGGNVSAASFGVDGLKSMVGTIDQPENDWIKIAQMAKGNDNMKPLTDMVAQQTGVRASDVESVPDDYSHAHRNADGSTPLILSEVLVARLCCYVSESKEKQDNGTEKITITRNCRDQSYACFYGRKMSAGFHLLDTQGGRIELKVPSAGTLPQFDPVMHGEAPPLFLPTANVTEEFFGMLRKEGLNVQGKHLDFSNMPPSKITDPDTLLSKFIFIDVQSTSDLGSFGGNPRALQDIAASYGNGQFLWEPRGFYDKSNESDDSIPAYAADKESQMVGADELVARAQRAAGLNSQHTPYCEPTFFREQLLGRRNEENCFRVTELAIPRGSKVTILGKPVKNAQGKVMLVPPNSAEDGADVDNPDAQRFRFRILKGHTVENLLKQRSLNVMAYYGFAVVGAFLTMWAWADYPGLTKNS